MLLISLLSIVLATFTHTDLESSDSTFVLVVYERETACPLCIYTENFLTKNAIAFKYLYFNEDPSLAKKLQAFSFPKLILYEHKRVHNIPIQYLDVWGSEKRIRRNVSHANCNRWTADPNNMWLQVYASVLYCWIWMFYKLQKLAVYVPDWIVTILIGVIFGASFCIVVEVIYKSTLGKEKDKKRKNA